MCFIKRDSRRTILFLFRSNFSYVNFTDDFLKEDGIVCLLFLWNSVFKAGKFK